MKPSRRRFLRGAAGATIALPFFSSLMKSARADEFPRRLILFFSPNGTVPAAWTPTTTSSGLSFGEILSPLEDLKSQVTVISGLDNDVRDTGAGGPHPSGMGSLWSGVGVETGDLFGADDPSGWGGGITVDQYIAQQLGQVTAFSSLEFGVHSISSSVRSRMSYLGPAAPVPPESDPAAAFARIFGDYSTDPGELERLRAERKSILDTVDQDMSALVKRLGGEDRQKLEAHLTAIRALETGLDNVSSSLSCGVPSAPPAVNASSLASIPDIGKLQMDLMAMALACDRTRVASLIWNESNSMLVHTWLGQSSPHHTLSHEPESSATAQTDLIAINRWYAEQFAYLLGALAAVQEGDETLLDHTVAIWGTEIAVGPSHSDKNMPFVMGGSCGRYFKTGHHRDFAGLPHNNLLVSLCNAMGVDDTTFGNPEFCSGALSGLTT